MKHGPVLDPVQHDYIMPTRKQVREMVEWYAQAEPRMHEDTTPAWKEPVDRPITVKPGAGARRQAALRRAPAAGHSAVAAERSRKDGTSWTGSRSMRWCSRLMRATPTRVTLIGGSGNDHGVHDSFKLEVGSGSSRCLDAKVEHGNIAMHSVGRSSRSWSAMTSQQRDHEDMDSAVLSEVVELLYGGGGSDIIAKMESRRSQDEPDPVRAASQGPARAQHPAGPRARSAPVLAGWRASGSRQRGSGASTKRAGSLVRGFQATRS